MMNFKYGSHLAPDKNNCVELRSNEGQSIFTKKERGSWSSVVAFVAVMWCQWRRMVKIGYANHLQTRVSRSIVGGGAFPAAIVSVTRMVSSSYFVDCQVHDL